VFQNDSALWEDNIKLDSTDIIGRGDVDCIHLGQYRVRSCAAVSKAVNFQILVILRHPLYLCNIARLWQRHVACIRNGC
jgi:hypothetical protein